jgi:hypothetical protein
MKRRNKQYARPLTLCTKQQLHNNIVGMVLDYATRAHKPKHDTADMVGRWMTRLCNRMLSDRNVYTGEDVR